MTGSAKWVLGIFLALSAALAWLGLGMAERQSRAAAPAANDPRAVELYLMALRGELSPWLASLAGKDPALASRLAAAAVSQTGRAYVYGGAGPSGFDCSGLTSWAFARSGVSLARTSAGQFAQGRPVATGALRTGDLVFFAPPGGGVNHVGMYLSGGRFIHSSRGSGKVAVDDLGGTYWSRTYAGARRVAP